MTDPAPAAATSPSIGRIALALSGGGYRAAAFHLGVLQVLHRLGILGDVAILSTASGGSIVGASYLRSLLDREPFPSFVDRTIAFLTGTNVVRKALESLQARGEHRPPSLIRAAAAIYRNELLGDIAWARLRAADYDGHIREVVINATEFTSGNGFRFQRSDGAQTVFGNNNVRVDADAADRVLLADSVAASACFPGAFEPMVLPDDFTWAGGAPPLPQVALMDGGIFDNQGINGVMLAEQRDRGAGRANLVIISDTDRKDGDFVAVKKPRSAGFLRLRNVRWLAWMLFVAALLTIAASAVDVARVVRAGGPGLAAVVPLASMVVSLAAAAGLFYVRRLLKDAMARVPFSGFQIWNVLKRLRVMDLFTLLELRAKSVLALTTGVFMKRVRGLLYDLALTPEREGELLPTLIYTLATRTDPPAPDLPAPTDRIRQIASAARDMETTLWFADRAELEQLTACGRLTLCYSLLRNLDKRAQPSSALQARAGDLWKELVEDPLAWRQASDAGVVTAVE